MVNAVLILFFVLGILLGLVLLIELISGTYKRIKMNHQEKQLKEESIRNTFEEFRHRLDYFGDCQGDVNRKLCELEVKLNEKKSNRTKRNK